MERRPINYLKGKLSLGEDPIHFLAKAAAGEEADDRILEWAGFLALENKKWLEAENIFSSLLERRKKVSDLMGLAAALYRQGRWNEAQECYLCARDRITEPCALLFIVHKCLGDIYLLKSDFSMAEEYYNKAGAFKFDCKDLIFKRAMLRLKEKNYEEAEKHFQHFVKISPSSPKGWLGLALVKKAIGDSELAKGCLDRALDFDPANSKALSLRRKWSPSVMDLLSSKALSFSS